MLKKSWQKCSLDIIANFAKINNNINLKNKISLCYRKYNDGFYVKSDKKINNIFEIAKYIGRYLARPAITEYRITVMLLRTPLLHFGIKNLTLQRKYF